MKRHIKYIVMLLSSLVLIFQADCLLSQSLVINEIMASNATTIADEDGDYPDWIELYNSGTEPVNLHGFMISDQPSNPGRWTFPSIVIEPGEFLLIFASGKNRHEGPYLHTNFSISASGEYLLLSNPQYAVIDYFSPVELLTDNAYGRLTDGADSLVFFQGATPGYSNNGQPLFVEYIDALLFSHEQGFYQQAFLLQVENMHPDGIIRFTTDGSEPTPESAAFPDSMMIVNRSDDENYFSSIRTNPETTPAFYRWHPPDGYVFKGTIIKARSFVNDTAVSATYTRTFWVHPEMHQRYNQLPVISIVADSLSLFDYETGIYVPGLHHDLNPGWGWVWGTGNYHQRGEEWERPANLAFFEHDGNLAFQQDVGIRIHGDGSRALPQKTLRVYARNLYGKNTIDYAFFPETGVDSYRRILLRNSGQDFYTTMLTDALTHRLVEHLDLETQSVRPAVVFINGEFWGIHHIRDRIDKYYFEYCCGADPDAIDYLENEGVVIEGSNQAYTQLKAFIAENDLSADHIYLQVAEQIDIENYITYTIAKHFVATFDWPGNNNEYWRKQESGAKWRWLFFDNDQSMVNDQFNALKHSTVEGNTGWPNPDWSTFLLRNLFKSEIFTQQYLDRFEYHLLHTFTEERINQQLDSLLYQIEPLMEEQMARWNYPMDFSAWVQNIYKIRAFAQNRPCYMLHHLIQFFQIEDENYASGVCDTINVKLPKPGRYAQEMILWPNPATDHLGVKLKQPVEMLKQIVIYDTYGRMVKEIDIMPSPYLRNFQIQLDGVSAGTYVLRLYTGNHIFTKRFVVFR